jgi:hypothetical protein
MPNFRHFRRKDAHLPVVEISFPGSDIHFLRTISQGECEIFERPTKMLKWECFAGQTENNARSTAKIPTDLTQVSA